MVSGVVASAAQAVDSGTLYRHHSIGASTFLQSEHGKVFQQVWQMPVTAVFGKHLGTNLSLVAHSLFTAGTNPPPAESLGILQSFLQDLADHESLLDVRAPGGRTEWTLAVQLPPPRRAAWDQGIRNLLKAGKLGESKSASWAGVSGSQAILASGKLSWLASGDWLVVGLASNLPTIWKATVGELRSSKRPVPALTSNAWMHIDADLAKLSKAFPVIPEFLDARLDLTLVGKGENVRMDGTLRFPTPLGWEPVEWDVPINLIHDPVVGFSAARGIGALTSRSEDLRKLGLTSFPNQASAWSMAGLPYLAFAAFPQPGSSNLLRETLPRIPNLITNYGRLIGEMTWVSNTTQVLWRGMPFVNPSLRAITEGSKEYMVGGLMPFFTSKRKAPPELFGFMGRTNLAYYDWEITETRVRSWSRIVQSSLIGFFRESPSTNAPVQALMECLGEKGLLGNSVTEITVTGPSELTLMRQSHVGLTGLEIVSGLRWVDSARFPFTFDRAPALDLSRRRSSVRAASPTNQTRAVVAPRAGKSPLQKPTPRLPAPPVVKTPVVPGAPKVAPPTRSEDPTPKPN